jgi:hypothetical protein
MGLLRFSGILLLAPALLLPAEQDALTIDNNIRDRHLPYQTVIDPVLGPGGVVVSYTRCGDSATWTGHYLAAEAYRYNVTLSAAALQNITTALAGLTRLTDVTGNDALARCAIPADSPYLAAITSEEKANGAYNATVNGTRWVWIGNTSRDQYSGVFFGLSAAYELLPDAAIRARIAALVTRLLDHLVSGAWNVILPDGTVSTTFLLRPDQQLALLQIGARVNPDHFRSEYTRLTSSLALSVSVPLFVDSLDDRSSYFKFNLAFINLFSLIRFETNASNLSSYEKGFALVRSATDNHHNPHFNMIDRALHGPNTARDRETRVDLDAWLKRPRTDVFIDLRGKVPACGSQACDPIPIDQRPPADFLWQSSPFLLFGGNKGDIEGAGVDYLLPYWMARFYGIAPPPAGRRSGLPRTSK